MKKRTLKEELERIHSISYGKKVLVEDDFLTKLLQGDDSNNTKPVVDDPTKADYVTDDVKKYFDDLKSITTPIKQQTSDGYEYQKEVELIQIGLILLGYELPLHGVDGLFGPETAEAVKKYKKDNNIISETFSPYSASGNVKINGGVDTNINNTLQGKINAIASEYGKPFTIISGYRDPERNEKAGGVSKSQHLDHNAVDVSLDDKSIASTLAFVAISSKNGIGGIGIYKPGSIHIDIGPRRAWGPDKSSNSILPWAKSTIQDHLNSKIDTGYVPSVDNVDGGDTSSTNEPETVSPEMIQSMVTKLGLKGVTKDQLDKLIDKVTTGGSDIFTDLDLTTNEGFEKYAKICDLFIKTREPNPLGITGRMLTDGAKMAFTRHHKYVPPELALGQLATEGGIGNSNPQSTPIVTKNPFDVANTETSSKYFSTVQDGINAYYDLIARKYLGNGKTSNDLIYNFVNKDNQRYAGSQTYENVVASVAKRVNKIARSLENT
jgi:peptidoglycan hydrolase-like protein with peptidoglycan-binding domain